MTRLTIAICTHNRADILERFLALNIENVAAHPAVEVLVINNNSTDRSEAVLVAACTMAAARGVALRVINEPQLGLSVARNRAIFENKSPLLAFIDDDAYIDSTWVDAVLNAFDGNSDLVAAGGPVHPVFAAERPQWLDDGLLWAYSLDLRTDGSYGGTRHPLGVNMAFRVKALPEFSFSVKLGRVGSSMISAEESLLFFGIFDKYPAGVKFFPLMKVFHYVPPDRLTKEWLLGRYVAEGRSKAILANIQGKNRAGQVLKISAKYAAGILLSVLPAPESKRFAMSSRLSGWRAQLKGLWHVA